MKFCSECGSGVEIPKEITAQDTYAPIAKPFTIITRGSSLAHFPPMKGGSCFCCRAIEPRYGYWTLPAGFMELGESVSDAAARETWEEAEAKVGHGTTLYRRKHSLHWTGTHILSG